MTNKAPKHDHSIMAGVDVPDGADGNFKALVSLADKMAGNMQEFLEQLENLAFAEFRIIAEYITHARAEVATLRPNDMKHSRIPTAGAELEAIAKNTEDATNEIMAAAEAIMSLDADANDYAEQVNAQIMTIFEACSFQDITGQRIAKVVETLGVIEGRVGKFADAMGIHDQAHDTCPTEQRNKDQILNGPGLDGEATSQDDIDALFDDKSDGGLGKS